MLLLLGIVEVIARCEVERVIVFVVIALGVIVVVVVQQIPARRLQVVVTVIVVVVLLLLAGGHVLIGQMRCRRQLVVWHGNEMAAVTLPSSASCSRREAVVIEWAHGLWLLVLASDATVTAHTGAAVATRSIRGRRSRRWKDNGRLDRCSAAVQFIQNVPLLLHVVGSVVMIVAFCNKERTKENCVD